MRTVLIALLAVLPMLALGQTNDNPCTAQGSPQACYGLTSQGLYCLWNRQRSVCEQDSCNNKLTMQSCVDSGCMPLWWQEGQAHAVGCMNANMTCWRLTEAECWNSGYCAWRDGYCASLLEPRIGKTDAECDIKFPQWSIALIIIWVCIMVILGFIIFLIVNKGKQAAIKDYERSEPVVDSLNLRDNFQLQQPLAQP